MCLCDTACFAIHFILLTVSFFSYHIYVFRFVSTIITLHGSVVFCVLHDPIISIRVKNDHIASINSSVTTHYFGEYNLEAVLCQGFRLSFMKSLDIVSKFYFILFFIFLLCILFSKEVSELLFSSLTVPSLQCFWPLLMKYNTWMNHHFLLDFQIVFFTL